MKSVARSAGKRGSKKGGVMGGQKGQKKLSAPWTAERIAKRIESEQARISGHGPMNGLDARVPLIRAIAEVLFEVTKEKREKVSNE